MKKKKLRYFNLTKQLKDKFEGKFVRDKYKFFGNDFEYFLIHKINYLRDERRVELIAYNTNFQRAGYSIIDANTFEQYHFSKILFESEIWNKLEVIS